MEEKIKLKKNRLNQIKNHSRINKKIEGVQNPELKDSLSNFLKAFNEKNK